VFATIRLFTCFAALSLLAQQSGDPILVKSVEPDYSDLGNQPYVIDQQRVEVLVDGEGVPVHVTGRLPHKLVQALAQYRFRQNSKGYRVAMTIPLRVPVSEFEGRERVYLEAPRDALTLTTAASVAEIESRLSPNADSIPQRVSLLARAARSEGEAAAGIRGRQIAWLVQNQPAEGVLGSSAALINEAEGPLPDAAAFARVRGLWLDALAKNPNDVKVLEHASLFLRLGDPAEAERMLLTRMNVTHETPIWLGDLYALSALRVTAVDLRTGLPVAAPPQLPGSGFAVRSRTVLTESNDLRVLLSGFYSLTRAASSLQAAGRLPDGYQPLCESIRSHILALKSNANLSCDVKPPAAAKDDDGPKRMNPAVIGAQIRKQPQPSYPPEARARRIQGRVRFAAIIGKDGKIRDLQLVSGPLALYEASREAVLKWEYRPTTVEGKPVDVSTEIDVNFTLR
jgi:TonB family protein